MEQVIDLVVPDGVSDATVVEIMQQSGAQVATDDSLIAVETDKATAEIPAPCAGTIAKLDVQVGTSVSSGDVIGQLQVQSEGQTEGQNSLAQEPAAEIPSLPVVSEAVPAPPPISVPANAQKLGASIHASPSVRQFARELGADLSLVKQPSGPNGRITFSDVKNFVKAALRDSSPGIPQIELPDFSKFGLTEEQSLSRIKQLSGEHLARGWLNIPLVTHFDETDISELEEFRKELNNRPTVSKGDLPRTTVLTFIVRAVIRALQEYPQLNSSLNGKSLILKKYYNIGIAVDTPRGLLVPVIKNAEQLSLDEISTSIRELGSRGRAGKLEVSDMEGGSFTISSLGSLGGSAFTPLVNSPEVAILGVAKSAIKAVWNGSAFVPRLVLPFSVSYDHRILDGAEVARFASLLGGYLRDLRYILV